MSYIHGLDSCWRWLVGKNRPFCFHRPRLPVLGKTTRNIPSSVELEKSSISNRWTSASKNRPGQCPLSTREHSSDGAEDFRGRSSWWSNVGLRGHRLPGPELRALRRRMDCAGHVT